MNVWRILGNERKFAVYGAGNWGGFVADLFGDRIDFFIDRDQAKQGTLFCGKEVKAPEALNEYGDIFIVIASFVFYREIAETLKSFGLSNKKDFTVFLALYDGKRFTDSFPLLDMTVDVCQICNSRCTMCDIWKNTTDNAVLSFEDFSKTVSDEFLINLRILIITGGEPTLVNELPTYIEFAIDRLPTLETLIISVNCILAERTLNMIRTINAICEQYNVAFQVNLSINGVGEVHDITRGTFGNFDSVMEVMHGIRGLKSDNILIHISTRIVKSNVFDMEEFLWFLKKEHLHSAAIFPAGQIPWFNSGTDMLVFDSDELYQINLLAIKQMHFFQKEPLTKVLQFHNFTKQSTGVDLADCRRAKGYNITILSNGSNLFCNTLLHTLKQGHTLKETYCNNLPLLDFIRYNTCDSCIFCPCVEPNNNYRKYEAAEAYWRDFYTIDAYYTRKEFVLSEVAPNALHKRGTRTVLITGWYGTETVGDRAILGQIITEQRKKDKDVCIRITSAYPFVTERTLYELGESAEIIPLFDKAALFAATQADEVIMGGGPLMEMEWLSVPLWLFSFAKQSGRKTVVHGCGIGPIKTDRGKKTIAEILSLADGISVRDSASAEIARQLTGRDNIAISGDPAVKYIQKKFGNMKRTGTNGVLACFLREITDEYFVGTQEEYLEYRTGFETALAGNIKNLCRERNLRPYFYAMHNFVVGGDDRDFAYRFVDEQCFENGSYDIYNKLTSIEVIVDAMISADLCLCMRFHSTVFADTLGVPYITIDYTNGGKVKGFLGDIKKSERLVSIDEIKKDSGALVRNRMIHNSER